MSRKYNKEQLLEAIKDSYGIISKVAKILDCSWATAETYINKWKETISALKDENEKVLDLAESKLIVNINSGDMSAIKFILATKGKKRGYVEKIQQEVVIKHDFTKPFIIEGVKKEDVEVNSTTKTRDT